MQEIYKAAHLLKSVLFPVVNRVVTCFSMMIVMHFGGEYVIFRNTNFELTLFHSD